MTDGNELYRTAVNEFIAEHDFVFDVASDQFRLNNAGLTHGYLADLMHLQLDAQRLGRAKLLTQLRLVADARRDEEVTKVRNRLGAGGESDDVLQAVLCQLMAEDTKPEAFADAVVAVKQWIWLVRRQMFGLPQEHHLMLILHGPQGAGKSTFVRRLLAPLATLAASDDFSLFNDQFAARRLNLAYVLFLDEMGYVSKADASKLKDTITRPEIGGRRMYDDGSQRFTRNATFIACTNTPPPHGLPAEAGSRRFFSIECRPDAYRGSRGAILRSFAPIDVWNCVDETGPAPILARLETIRAFQRDELCARPPLEAWLAEEVVAAAPDEGRLSLRFISDRLKAWMDRHNVRSRVPTQPEIMLELKALGYQVRTSNNRPFVKGLALRDELLDEPACAARERGGARRPAGGVDYLRPLPRE